MEVLHLDSGREMRGGQWQVLYLLGGLRDAGCQSALLAPAGAPLFERARQSGFTVEPLTAPRLVRWARRFDLIHAHDAHSHTLAALAARRPLIVSRRVAFPIRRGVLSAWKYRRPDLFLAVSEFVASRLRDRGVPDGRVRIIYDAVPMVPMWPGTRDGVLAVATGDPRKGSALAELAAGEAGVPLKFSSNLAEDLEKTAIFVYLSHEEGLGSAILLAMMAGAAVVASRVGGIPELIREEATGLLVDNEVSSVAAAIRRLHGNPALRSEMACRARRIVEQRFTIARMTEATLGAYREVLG